MQAVTVATFDGDPKSAAVAEVPVPEPGRGEVLVRMISAPINPNDLMFLEGRYFVKRPPPATVGFEGVGVVVDSGGGFIPRMLVGRRVACSTAERGGTWAEYTVSSAARCVPLRRALSDVRGATMLTNPFTAWVLFDRCRRDHSALIQTAAAGALGRMIVRLCREFAFEGIHVVRREAQARELRDLGARHVLDSSSPSFDEELTELAGRLGARICLDAVTGALSGRILAAMPPDSTLLVYGRLSRESMQVDPYGVLFERKRVEGFNMYDWVRGHNLLQQALVAWRVQKHLDGALEVDVRDELPLARVQDALVSYRAEMSGGKILLRCTP
jgi:NADPH:quinone reductase-like Zn-dependent oxidoreductase